MNPKKLYKMAKSAYYDGVPIISDARFDKLEDYLKAKYPEWAELKKTGTKPKAAVKLPVFMPSLDKLYPDNAKLPKFFDGKKMVLDKLDGASVLLTYIKGKPARLTTRGNGTVGKDISYLIKGLNLPEQKATFSCHIRCEAVMTRKTFAAHYADKYDNARNLVNGLLNRHTVSPELADVRLVALGVYGLPYLKSYQALRAIKFPVPFAAFAKDETGLSALLAERKLESPYEIDGLVLIDPEQEYSYESAKRPKWTYAFKNNGEAIKAKVLDIEWNLHSSGRYIPKAILQPVRLGGTTISKVAAHNAKWIKERKLGPGAVIELVKAGDVIPKIVSVLKPGKDTKPKGGAKLVGVHYVTTDAMASNEPKRIQTFLKALGVMGLSSKSLIKCGELTLEEFLTEFHNGKLRKRLVVALGDKTADKTWASLSQALKAKHPVSLILGSAGVVDGIGTRKFAVLAEAGALKTFSKTAITETWGEKAAATKTVLANHAKLVKFAKLVKATLNASWSK